MEQSPLKSRRGRPRLDITDEERRERKLQTRRKSAGKYQNISLDVDAFDQMSRIQTELEGSLGVRLTISQTFRYLIHLYSEGKRTGEGR